MKVDGCVMESAAPFDHCCVVVRMRDGDGLYAAETRDVVDGGLIEKADAVPENVAGICLEKKSALTDAEVGIDREGSQVMFLGFDFCFVGMA